MILDYSNTIQFCIVRIFERLEPLAYCVVVLFRPMSPLLIAIVLSLSVLFHTSQLRYLFNQLQTTNYLVKAQDALPLKPKITNTN